MFHGLELARFEVEMRYICILEPGPNQRHTMEYNLAVRTPLWSWKKVSTILP